MDDRGGPVTVLWLAGRVVVLGVEVLEVWLDVAGWSV
jgi:hypothetical protein